MFLYPLLRKIWIIFEMFIMNESSVNCFWRLSSSFLERLIIARLWIKETLSSPISPINWVTAMLIFDSNAVDHINAQRNKAVNCIAQPLAIAIKLTINKKNNRKLDSIMLSISNGTYHIWLRDSLTCQHCQGDKMQEFTLDSNIRALQNFASSDFSP